MIDILYVSFNRYAYTRETFAALVEHTNWEQVFSLYVADDGSTDGSLEFLREYSVDVVPEHVSIHFPTEKLGGPVAAMNWYLDVSDALLGRLYDIDVFAKVDNDMVVCPGWLDEMFATLDAHPDLDILGMEPFVGDPRMPPHERGISGGAGEPLGTFATHIGGKGLIRRRAFNKSRPEPGGFNGYQGFTQWQHAHPEIRKAWITPDLPVFGLDQVRWGDGPWRHLAVEYETCGWQRLWPVYGSDEHYNWWSPAFLLP